MKGLWPLCLSACLAASALLACGGGGGSKSSGDEKASEAMAPAPATGGSGLDPCALLTGEQVTTVLPGHDGGFVAKAGGSLVEGIDAYQCSYTTEAADLLTVILNVAVDDEKFETLKPSSLITGDAKPVDVGDGGWLRGEADDVKLTALRGRTRIDLELMAADAEGKADALAKLAAEVAARIE